jgi:hypothetical protein
MTSALEGAEWSVARPGLIIPPWKTRYPFSRRLGGPPGRSGQVRKISPPPGFDPRTVQPVAQSLYRLSYRAPLLFRFPLGRLFSSHIFFLFPVLISLITFSPTLMAVRSTALVWRRLNTGIAGSNPAQDKDVVVCCADSDLWDGPFTGSDSCWLRASNCVRPINLKKRLLIWALATQKKKEDYSLSLFLLF